MSHNPAVARPKLDKTKDALLNFRVYPELRDAIEEIARAESRTVSQMCDLLLRQAVIDRLRSDRKAKQAKTIEDLP